MNGPFIIRVDWGMSSGICFTMVIFSFQCFLYNIATIEEPDVSTVVIVHPFACKMFTFSKSGLYRRIMLKPAVNVRQA